MMSQHTCLIPGCKKVYKTVDKLDRHFDKKHGLSLAGKVSSRSAQKSNQSSLNPVKRKTHPSLEGSSTKKQRKPERPAKRAPAATTSSIFELVDLRTPSPRPSFGLPPIVRPSPPPETPQSQWTNKDQASAFNPALSPDSTSSNSSTGHEVLRTPAQTLTASTVRVAPARPTWVVETPTPPPRPKPSSAAKVSGISHALVDDTILSDEDRRVDTCPFDFLGKAFGSESSQSETDQLDEEMDLDNDERGSSREDTPTPMFGPVNRVSPSQKIAKPTNDQRPERSSPFLGPAFDMFLPERQNVACKESSDNSAPTPVSNPVPSVGEKVEQAGASQAMDKVDRDAAGFCTLETPTKPTTHPSPQDSSASISKTLSPSSSAFIGDLLRSHSAPPHPSEAHSHCPSPRVALDIIQRIASAFSSQCKNCEACQGSGSVKKQQVSANEQ